MNLSTRCQKYEKEMGDTQRWIFWLTDGLSAIDHVGRYETQHESLPPHLSGSV